MNEAMKEIAELTPAAILAAIIFSILGGLKAYGLLGLILGPILVASVLVFVRIYKEAYGA